MDGGRTLEGGGSGQAPAINSPPFAILRLAFSYETSTHHQVLSLSFENTHLWTLAQANYYIDVFSVRYQSKYPHERPLGLGKVPVLNQTSPRDGLGEASGGGGGGGGGLKSKAS